MSPLELMLLPFLECLVLVGIHSYLGIHVIKRKVIFVDLALAQIAALGAIVAFLFGLTPQSNGAYVFSLLFTFIGAAVFSLTRLRRERIPQEAIIGLVYALAAALAILIIDRAPHGAEHIKEILTGSILWVKGSTVLTAAFVYLGVGIFHFIFWRRFLLISNDPQQAYEQGIPVRLWDFLFYMSFGLVITHSVQTAGVLLVFVFLVVPAIIAILITDRLLYQLIIGWAAGTLVSLFGLTASYVWDFPSGPTVVSVYGAALLLVALVLYVLRHRRRRLAVLHVAVGIVVTAAIALGFRFLGNSISAMEGEGGGPAHHAHHAHHGGAVSPNEPIAGSGTPAGEDLLGRLTLLDLVGKTEILAGETDLGTLQRLAEQSEDDELRMAVATRLMELDPSAGCEVLVTVMAQSETPLFRNEALALLVEHSADDFGFDPLEDPASAENRLALAQWQSWLQQRARN